MNVYHLPSMPVPNPPTPTLGNLLPLHTIRSLCPITGFLYSGTRMGELFAFVEHHQLEYSADMQFLYSFILLTIQFLKLVGTFDFIHL